MKRQLLLAVILLCFSGCAEEEQRRYSELILGSWLSIDTWEGDSIIWVFDTENKYHLKTFAYDLHIKDTVIKERATLDGLYYLNNDTLSIIIEPLHLNYSVKYIIRQLNSRKLIVYYKYNDSIITIEKTRIR